MRLCGPVHPNSLYPVRTLTLAAKLIFIADSSDILEFFQTALYTEQPSNLKKPSSIYSLLLYIQQRIPPCRATDLTQAPARVRMTADIVQALYGQSISSTSRLSKAHLLHRQSSGSTRLSAKALATQNAHPSMVDYQWALEEENRVKRLQKAARELGFELPSRCFR